MFEDTLRELGRLDGVTKFSIELELDDKGCLDRLCPSAACRAPFKVRFEDWRNIVRDEVVYCPLCRHDDPASDWNTPEQSEQIKGAALAHVQRRLGRALGNDSRRFNARQPRGGLIKMSMSYRPGRTSVAVPATATDVMTQEFDCPECHCRYSSVGAAFFCPSCGHNSVLETFKNSVETVRKTMDALPGIREAIAEETGENVAEDSIRHITENGLVKLVSSLQRYAEALFSLPAERSPIRGSQELVPEPDGI